MNMTDPQEDWEAWELTAWQLSPQSLAEKIIQKRENEGHSQRSLALLLGLSNSTVACLEKGLTENPNPHTMHTIRKWLRPDLSMTCPCIHCRFGEVQKVIQGHAELDTRLRRLEELIRVSGLNTVGF